MQNQHVLLEAHVPFKEDKALYPKDGGFIVPMLNKRFNEVNVDWDEPLAIQVAKDQTGLPAVIGSA